nr:putative ribonuclease H-like domain-containing protein [Tanacetum cinerariifolium]
MESSTIVSAIRTHRVHLDHPKDQILGYPKLAVHTKGMEKKSSGADALVYVYDIIFGSTKKSLSDEFEGFMHKRLMMSSIGELTFFLGLHVKQSKEGIFISQDKYLKGQPKLGLWYPRDSPFDFEAYSDSDYAGANLDRKSTTGGCQFLGRILISWQCKKQTIVATSTTEAEYVVAANCFNSVKQIHAIVDGKAVVISESSVSTDLLFNGEDGADNRPPMLEKDMYDSWKSIMELYMLNCPHGRIILELVEQGPLIWPSVEVDRVTRLKKYSESSGEISSGSIY